MFLKIELFANKLYVFVSKSEFSVYKLAQGCLSNLPLLYVSFTDLH